MSEFTATEPEAAEPLDPQVAAELAQELTLVARAMFAQLLPDTATNAVAAISARATVAQTPEAVPNAAVVPPAVPVVSVPLPSLQEPLPVTMAPATRIPVQPGAAAEPGHTPPVAVPVAAETETDAVKPADPPAKPAPRTMAMLEEITFLDE